MTFLACGGLLGATLMYAYAADAAPAIYALSFWHYYIYWLAFAYRVLPHAAFKRDAVAAKTLSIVALALVYFSTPLDVLSLVVIALGFGINMAAANVLGSDRTYYGAEIAGLAPERVTRFPYSITAHPMLIGNMVAFAGTLLNAEFRAGWAPLALLHVAANAGLWIMEVWAEPRRAGAIDHPVAVGVWVALGGAAIGIILDEIPGALLGAAVFACAYVLHVRYSRQGWLHELRNPA